MINVILLSNQSVGLSLVEGHHILKYEWPFDNDEKSSAVKQNKNQFDSAGIQNNEISQMIVSSCLEDMDTTVRQQKAALRKQMNQVLNALPKHEVVRQSKIVTNKVLQHPKYVEAQSVSVYLSFDQEIQTGDLLEDIFKSGKICYIPRFRKGSSEMEMIRLFSMEDLNKLPVNKWNIRQPLDDEIRESVFEAGKLDLVLNPGLVFTPDGKRLGRGKAYYDQFLHKCSKQLKNSPVTLALAFKEQILPHLPTTPTDYIMDYVLYED